MTDFDKWEMWNHERERELRKKAMKDNAISAIILAIGVILTVVNIAILLKQSP